ncbi:MAG: hypothetical protein ABF904_11600 [Ethanoligenens sp.]
MKDNFNERVKESTDLEMVLKKLPAEVRQRILDHIEGALMVQEAEEKKSA